MSLNAQVLGGRHDGMVVPCIGPVLVMPVPLVRSFLTQPDAGRLPPVGADREYYKLRQGDDGELFYVLE